MGGDRGNAASDSGATTREGAIDGGPAITPQSEGATAPEETTLTCNVPVSRHLSDAEEIAARNTSPRTAPPRKEGWPRAAPLVPRIPLSPRTVHDNKVEEEEPERASVFQTPREMTVMERRLAYVALLLIVTCINSTFSLMAPVLPTEAERRGLKPIATGLIFSIYSLCNFFASPLHGRILQRRLISRKTLLVFGLMLSAAASTGFAVSSYIPDRHAGFFTTALLLFRMVNGVGAAAVDVSSMAMVTQFFRTSDYFGTALGVLESSLAVGWMVGPLFGGYLASWGGFSAPFYAAALVALVLIPIPLLMPGDQGTIQPTVHSAVMVTQTQLLQQFDIALLMVVTVISAAAVTFLDATLAPFLQDTEGFSAGRIGVCFAVIAASYAMATPLAGWLSDRTSPMAVIVVGQLVSVVPFALLGPSPLLQQMLRPVRGQWHIWASLAILGAGCAFGLMPVLPAILNAAEEAQLSHVGLEDLVSGLVGGAYYLGAGAGPILGGLSTSLMGFAWASTTYGMGLLLLSAAMVVTLGCVKRQRLNLRESEALLENDCLI